MLMKSFSVRQRLAMVWLVLAVIGVALLVVSLQQLHQSLLADRTKVLEERVRTAYQQVNNFHLLALNGDLTHEQAKQSSLAMLRQLRYGDDEYFWVIDLQGEVKMHPVRPELEGQALATGAGSVGAALHTKIQQLLVSKGRGFFEYQWPRVGDTIEVDKIGFLMRFEPWGWGVASSVYTDDINKAFWDEASNLIIILMVLLAVLVIFWFGFEKALFMEMDDFNRARDAGDEI